MPSLSECENCRVSIASLSATVSGMSNRLDAVEKHQLELIELASFGKGSLKTLLRVGAGMAALAGIGLAIKTYLD